ncbi:MAG: hypothetical protein ACREKR_04850 [Candidatus Methylomirabilales bacterium]
MQRSRIGLVVLLVSFFGAGCGTCGARFSTAELEYTYWKLVRLGDQPVIVSPGRPEPYLRLVPEGRRAQGFAGCNRL